MSKAKESRRVSWNTIQPKKITWMWPTWIPSNKIVLLAGNAGVGKTTLAIDIAARLTSGRPMPLSDAAPIKGNVLIQTQEDDISDTLLPRCIAAGADLSRIESIEAEGLNIDEDCDLIEHHIKEINARMTIFDPLQSFMGKSADMCRITDIRRILTNLGAIAARNDCVILILAHQTKAQGANELHRVFGSVDITATARSVIQVSKSESDPDIRVISHIKSSVSRPEQPIAFRIEDDSKIAYLGRYDGEADFYEEIPDDSSKRAKAEKIIYTMLQEGPLESTEIFNACNDAGISTRTVERVKKELNVSTERNGNKRIWLLQ